jgi:glycosyltransferase involved in cell wall biosynthesis
MTTVHLIYPHGLAISCPDAIGRNLGRRLESWFDVKYYDWRDTRVIRPGPDDVLLGHPHPAPRTIFRRSARRGGWRRILILAPFNSGDLGQVAFLDRTIVRSDLYLAISGNHWFDGIGRTDVAHWSPKMRRLDLAIDRADFPRVKTAFSRPGERKFVYIGNANACKNVGFLESIARHARRHEISWIGAGSYGASPLRTLGRLDFSEPEVQRLLAEFDFLLTVGSADANPATILEAMAWGLVPVCTQESGYRGYTGIINVPLDDVAGAVAVLDRLQEASEYELRKLVAANDELLEGHFNWKRFSEEVRATIVQDGSPDLCRPALSSVFRLRWAEVCGPHSMAWPRNFARLWGSRARRRLRGLMATQSTGRSSNGFS